MKKTVYLYDFDKTLVDCESIVELWKYAFNKNKPIFNPLFNLIKSYFKSKIKNDFKITKNSMVSILKYFTEDELREFVIDFLLPKFIYKEFEENFKTHKKDSIKILCSASATNYLKYVRDVYDFDYIIGTDLDDDYKLAFENNKKMVKVKNINDLLKREGFEIDYENSMGYSDSYKDDRFMLELVYKRFLINSKVMKRGFINLSWTRKNK